MTGSMKRPYRTAFAYTDVEDLQSTYIKKINSKWPNLGNTASYELRNILAEAELSVKSLQSSDQRLLTDIG